MVQARTLCKIAVVIVTAPLLLALVGVLIGMIVPDCSPQMYGEGGCQIGKVEIGHALVILVSLGLWLSVVLATFVAFPMLIAAWWLDRKIKRRAA